jgi:hypothetical protein
MGGFENFPLITQGNGENLSGRREGGWTWSGGGVLNQAAPWGLGSGPDGSERVAYLQPCSLSSCEGSIEATITGLVRPGPFCYIRVMQAQFDIYM